MVHSAVNRNVYGSVHQSVTARRISGGALDAWDAMAAALPAGFTLWRPQVGYCWQDTARTVPALVGDPVRVIDDVKSGLHAVAPADAQRGILSQVETGGVMRQYVALNGSTTRYTINVPVTQRTLFAGLDDDADSALAILYGTGSLNDYFAVNSSNAFIARSAAVFGPAASVNTFTYGPAFVLIRVTDTTQFIKVEDFAELSNAVTPGSVTFNNIGSISPGGSTQVFNGKYFGGGIGDGAVSNETAAIIRTFIGSLIETPLQAGALFAYDMQEASGPLLPAKGGLEIAAFNSPGAADGPAEGITARSFTEASSQYFEHADNAVFRSPTSGVKTFRIWNRTPDPALSSIRSILFKANDATANISGSEWALDTTGTGRPRSFARRADDSAREFLQSALASSGGIWLRLELALDADLNQMRLYVGASESLSITVPGGFFQGTNPFRIARGTTNYTEGRLALLCCWDRALTTEERTADQTPRLWADL